MPKNDYTARLEAWRQSRNVPERIAAQEAAVRVATAKKARQETSAGATDTTEPDEGKSDEMRSDGAVLTKRHQNHLPVPLLTTISQYSGGGTRLGETYQEAYKAIPGHYKLDMRAAALHFGRVSQEQANKGFQPDGGRAGIRTVKYITITNAGWVEPEILVGYKLLEPAVQRVVTNAISTLESITVEGTYRRDNKEVAAIMAMLSQPEKLADGRVAPIRVASLLRKIKFTHSSISVKTLGIAAVADVFPALQSLTIARCHANKSHMMGLITAISDGHICKLRDICWDGLAAGEKQVSNLMLEAFSRGNCPEIVILSFIDNRGFDQEELSHLSAALKACPNLRELRMDTTMTPEAQLRELSVMIEAGDVPRLKSLEIRLPTEVSVETVDDIKDEMKVLDRTASSRVGSAVDVLMRFGRATLNSW